MPVTSNPRNTRHRATQKRTRARTPTVQLQPVPAVEELDTYTAIRTFALSSLDDKIFPDYAGFLTTPSRVPDHYHVEWRKVCEAISLQKSWWDEGRPQMYMYGKPWPGTDVLRVVEQIAEDIHHSAESIFWQFEAFKGRNKAIAGRKISKCIEDGDWQNLAELLTIDSRYMHGDGLQDQGLTVASETPVCDAIVELVCRYFVMIVDKEEGVEYVTTGARSEEGEFHLSTPFLDAAQQGQRQIHEQYCS